jgi:hypothetical protein
MLPIVDGLKDEFGEDVAFIYLNAKKGDGEKAFGVLSLRGHPSYVIFSTDGIEAYRALGVLEEKLLRDSIENQITIQ